MNNTIKQVVKRITYGPLSPVMAHVFQFVSNLEYHHFMKKWERQGWKRPEQSEIDVVRENVTIIFKGSVKNFVALVKNGSFLVRITDMTILIEKEFIYGSSKRPNPTDYYRK